MIKEHKCKGGPAYDLTPGPSPGGEGCLSGKFLLMPQHFADLVNHQFCFSQNIPVRKPDDSKEKGFQIFRSLRVPHRMIAFLMNAAIHFYHQAGFDAHEIRNVFANHMLPAKLESQNAAVSKMMPQLFFRRGWNSPVFFCQRKDVAIGIKIRKLVLLFGCLLHTSKEVIRLRHTM
jgi:hypothetical protein